jgi:hypothetical protein
LFLLFKGLTGRVKERPFLLALFFIWLNIIYVTVTGNQLEVGENNRFRFLVDPFYLILLGIFLTRGFPRPEKNMNVHNLPNPERPPSGKARVTAA